MKVGFIGSQGTGKTSVAEAFVKDKDAIDRNWKFVPSTARLAMKEGYKLNRDADELGQLLTTVSRIVTEFRTEDEVTSVVCDRTPLDSLAYTAYQMNHVWDDGNSYYWKVTEGLVEKHMKEYDKLFYFPVYWPPVADGDRDDSVEYQKQIDTYILAFMEVFRIEPIHMPDDTVENRVGVLRRHIFN